MNKSIIFKFFNIVVLLLFHENRTRGEAYDQLEKSMKAYASVPESMKLSNEETVFIDDTLCGT